MANKITLVDLYKAAVEVEKQTGIPALFIVAQAVLESGWEFMPIDDSNNIFGIKYHIPKWGYVKALTAEEEDGHFVHIVAKFQKYPLLADCIRDHTELLTRYSYARCLEQYKKDSNYARYVKCVARDYATDSKYANKILAITRDIVNELKKKGVSVMTPEDKEAEEAKKLMLLLGVFKPAEDTEAYWKGTPTREQLAIYLKRFVDCFRIAVTSNENSKVYVVNSKGGDVL